MTQPFSPLLPPPFLGALLKKRPLQPVHCAAEVFPPFFFSPPLALPPPKQRQYKNSLLFSFFLFLFFQFTSSDRRAPKEEGADALSFFFFLFFFSCGFFFSPPPFPALARESMNTVIIQRNTWSTLSPLFPLSPLFFSPIFLSNACDAKQNTRPPPPSLPPLFLFHFF